MRTEEQIRREIQILKDVPSLIELSKKIYDVLPETAQRAK